MPGWSKVSPLDCKLDGVTVWFVNSTKENWDNEEKTEFKNNHLTHDDGEPMSVCSQYIKWMNPHVDMPHSLFKEQQQIIEMWQNDRDIYLFVKDSEDPSISSRGYLSHKRKLPEWGKVSPLDCELDGFTVWFVSDTKENWDEEEKTKFTENHLKHDDGKPMSVCSQYIQWLNPGLDMPRSVFKERQQGIDMWQHDRDIYLFTKEVPRVESKCKSLTFEFRVPPLVKNQFDSTVLVNDEPIFNREVIDHITDELRRCAQIDTVTFKIDDYAIARILKHSEFLYPPVIYPFDSNIRKYRFANVLAFHSERFLEHILTRNDMVFVGLGLNIDLGDVWQLFRKRYYQQLQFGRIVIHNTHASMLVMDPKTFTTALKLLGPICDDIYWMLDKNQDIKLLRSVGVDHAVLDTTDMNLHDPDVQFYHRHENTVPDTNPYQGVRLPDMLRM